ncbi:MAG: SDR family NAD(P)-dependent oxidoreductase [Bacteroidales bacterium]
MTPIETRHRIRDLVPALRMMLSPSELTSCGFVPLEELAADRPDALSGLLGGPVLSVKGEGEFLFSEVGRMAGEGRAFLLLDGLGLLGWSRNGRTLENQLNRVRSKPHPMPDTDPGTGREPAAEIRSHLVNRVIAVTGGSMGFGEGIARALYHRGAHVVLMDINRDAGEKVADELNRENRPNRALFLPCDVSRFESVEEAVYKSVLAFGGIDAMISNAGVLRAGGIHELDPADFDFLTRVNYTGYYHVVRAVVPVMEARNARSEHAFSDIIQINSKSGLAGSKKNFAYAGGKFGGLGLTQSFALELMPSRIKVNAICPGNFFEGPLWSDPETGLFRQYLEAGKVPGAKTIADVKRYYESLVPAGRGCRVEDVVRAISYVIEQEYETGQAVPVTGGQVMLR